MPYDIKNALRGSLCGERELCRRSAPPHLSALSNFPLPIPRLSHSPACQPYALLASYSPLPYRQKFWAKIPHFFHDAQKSYRNPGFSSDLPAGLDIYLFFPCICPKTAGILGIAEKSPCLCPKRGLHFCLFPFIMIGQGFSACGGPLLRTNFLPLYSDPRGAFFMS